MNERKTGTAKIKSRFTVVDGLRGIAAIWVVLFHASEGHHIDSLKATLPDLANAILFDNGHYGVAIFFSLSGFVIAHSLRNVLPNRNFLGRFVLRRALRLDPPYWLSIAIVLALGFISARVQAHSFIWPSKETIFMHIFYLQTAFGLPNINSVYWTLIYEVQFYLFFATVLVLARALANRIPAAWPAAWIMMFALACASAAGLEAPTGLFVNLWSAFFVGVAAYYAPTNSRALVALLILVALMAWPHIGQGVFELYSALTAIILAAALATGRIKTALNWKWLQFLGTISYSLYLIHNPITGAVGFVMRKYAGVSVPASAATLAAIIFVSVLCAWIYWMIVERNAHALSRKVNLPRAHADGSVAYPPKI